jgi:hypothetical protein
VSTEETDPFAQAVARLTDEGLALEISGRTFRLVDPVRGDAGAAALRLLGMVQGAAPVAIATHGAQVAAAVWAPPRLYVARWARNRWVVGYRLAGGSRPNDYVRSEGRIPGHLEVGHWYESVPDEVEETFEAVGLPLTSAPFPVPAQPEPPPSSTPRRTAASGGRVSAAEKAPPARPAPRKVSAPKPSPAPKAPAAPTSRVCPGCNMRRTLTQFDPGSELCIDCRY